MKVLSGLPELIVTLAGRRLPAADVAPIAAVRVRLALAQPAQCLLTWHLGNAASARRLAVAAGDALRIEVGGRREPLFTGEVTVVEHAYGADASFELRVRAYDALHRLRMRQHTRLHEDVDLSRLARVLAEGTGLEVLGGAVDLGRVYQCARTDLETLVVVAARAGLYPVVDRGALRLVDLAGEGEPIDLALGATLHSAEIEVSQEPAFRSAETVRWDPASATASTERAERGMARAEVRADPEPQVSGGGGTLRRADEVIGAGPAAQALAQAEVDVRGLGEVTALLVADGDPRLRAGRRVRVTGVAPSLEGTYPVTEAVHTIDGTGYETVVSTRPPAGPPPRGEDVVTLGVVESMDDPERRGRALVRLAAHPDLVTDWAPVLIPGGGAGKGVVALPDDGDTVLVLMPSGDPANAVVLGGLLGTERTHDADDDGPRGGRYSVRTPGGQRVALDGHRRSLTVTDGQGSLLELGPDAVRLTSAVDLLIEAPGRALRLRAKTVDFEEAP